MRPQRLHHHAFVVTDQARTRAFYEDVLGLPLVATWTEAGNPATGGVAYCHTFYELADGSALAFFQFADPAVTTANQPSMPISAFDHVALVVDADTRSVIIERAERAGHNPFTIDHGYCESTYLTDPDGLLLELTIDNPALAATDAERRGEAHRELERWLAGDHTDNNPFRTDHA